MWTSYEEFSWYLIGEMIFPFPDEEADEDPEEDAPRPDIDLPPGVDPRDEPDCDDEEGDEEYDQGIAARNSHFPSGKMRNSGLHSPLFTSGRE